MPVLKAPDFSLQTTLTSGQTFRWHAQGSWWYGNIDGRFLRVRQEGDQLIYELGESRLSAGDIRRYFALDLDLGPVLKSIDVDPQIHQAIERYRGLRILRQDSWETLASFVLASFNNIKRIEGMIEGLCQSYGDAVERRQPGSVQGGQAPARPALRNCFALAGGAAAFTFPKPQRIAESSERKLRQLGLGYRAPYLLATARRVADGNLPMKQLRRVNYEKLKGALLACEGVGDKVADCVALFGFEKYEAFPVDIWMERVARRYTRVHSISRKRLHVWARNRFGQYAGYAQQYLYHDIRSERASG